MEEPETATNVYHNVFRCKYVPHRPRHIQQEWRADADQSSCSRAFGSGEMLCQAYAESGDALMTAGEFYAFEAERGLKLEESPEIDVYYGSGGNTENRSGNRPEGDF